jgi:regulator of extracellular matrix RemA (YlzA/DUF370 family)
MGRWIVVGKGGVLAADRVVAVARADSAPIKRLVEAVGRDRVVNLTFGQPRRAVVVLDSGHVVVVGLTPADLLVRLLEIEEGVYRCDAETF